MTRTTGSLSFCAVVALTFLLVSSPTRCRGLDSGTLDVPHCGRVEDLDFGNASFQSGGKVFSFHHGKAHSRDCSDCSGKWDWEAEIEKDVTVHPSANVAVRFLLVHDEHKTGTGWWYHLVGFRCAASGQLVKVFDRTAMSLHVETLSDDGVRLSLSDKNRRRRQYVYRWDGRRDIYTLAR